MLASFIKFLEEENLLDFSKLNFNTRLKIQKYVYISKSFGREWRYDYNMYIHGPYSRDLAEDYFKLHENPEPVTSNMPESFMEKEFTNLVYGKRGKWLNVATTLIDQKELFDDNKKLVSHVEAIKHRCSVRFIRSVLNDLIEYQVLV